ncbi:unnamed protein product [Urochloa humidicola]
MVEAQCFVQLAFPVVLKNTMMTEDIHYAGFLSKLLETKIMQVLRFKYGQIYSVNVVVFLGGNKPSRTGDVRGDISVNFSCDPDISSKLVDFVLEEISYLQAEGLSEEDVSTILEIEQRAHENGLQENYFWLDRILRRYQSRLFFWRYWIHLCVPRGGANEGYRGFDTADDAIGLAKNFTFPLHKSIHCGWRTGVGN